MGYLLPLWHWVLEVNLVYMVTVGEVSLVGEHTCV